MELCMHEQNLKFTFIAALAALCIPLMAQDRVLFSQDFESGFAECTAQGDTKIIEAPLGGKYVQCSLAESKGVSRISIPAIPLADAAAVEVKIKYRASRNGGQHFGPWVYIAVSDGTKTISEQFILCSATTTWREGVVRFLCPPGAKTLNVNPRLQATEGRVDWDDIVVSAVDAESLQKPKETKSTEDRSLAILTTFKLEKTPDGYVLTDGKTVLKNENQKPGLPLQFTLPDEWCENTTFIYDVQTEFKTYWNTRNASIFQTIFAINQNIMGYTTNSSVVTFLSFGKRIMSRIIGESFGDKAEISEPIAIESNRMYAMQSRFSATVATFNFDGNMLGRAPVPREFRWMKRKPFFVGGEAKNLSVLNGEIKSFTLSVLEEKIKCAVSADNFGYYTGSSPHSFMITFPREDGDTCASSVSVKDINGKEAVKISPVQKGKGKHTFILPPLPFGYYSLNALVSRDGAEKTIMRSISIMAEAARRESAERSSFGATEEWPLSREEFNPVMTDALLAKLKMMGIRWFRYWVYWHDIEETPGEYNFVGLDTVVAQAQEYGISLELTLTGGKKSFQNPFTDADRPKALAGPHYALPHDMPAWIKYVTALASRYRGKIKNYQIWNETDTKFYIYPYSPEAYLDILRRSAAAIREVDPKAIIHLAGFCSAWEPVRINQRSHLPDDNSYGLLEFYNLKPQKDFDISDYHFYCINEPGQSFDNFVPMVENLKRFLAEKGEGAKPLWDSETGLESTPDLDRIGKSGGLFNVPLLSEREHAIRIVTRQVQEISVGVSVVINYKVRDRGGFGYLRDDYSPTPVFPAMVNLANMIYEKTFDKQRLKQNANIRCYTFTNASSTLAVLWTIAGQEILTIRSESGADVFITDMMGNRKKAATSLLVTEEPVYIESKDRFTMSGIISMSLPDMIIENEPYDITLAMNNPFSESMKVIVAASISNAVLAKQEMSVPAQSEKTETVRISGAGSPLMVQGAIRGFLTQEFSIEQKIVARKAVRTPAGGEAAIDISQPRQVKIGGKTMDGQGREISEGQWRGTADLSAKGTISVNNRTISFSIVVMDNVLAPAEKDLYNGDAVELFIDMRAPADKKGMDGVYQVVVGANGKIWAARNKMPEGFTSSAAAGPGGWKLTGSFKLAANVSDRFGFDVSLDDADDASGRKTQMVWAGSEDNHRDASGYGIVIIK
mgnify:CR=1 FL=1